MIKSLPTNLLCIAFALVAIDRVSATDEMTPVLASVMAEPAPALLSDGKWRLVYEIELINATDAPLTIESVEAYGSAAGSEAAKPQLLATLRAADIEKSLAMPGGKTSANLGPAQSGVLFIDLTFDERSQIPQALVHRMTATTTDTERGIPPRTVATVASTPVRQEAPIVVGPPLRGDRWVAGASCCDSYHRKAMLPINGKRRLAQRFAIDWFKLDAGNRMATGNPALNASYPQYGAEVIAVAEATVVHVRDDLPDGTPGTFPSGVTADTADGNSVVLDLGGGRFALYAHFQPGSLRVKQHDRVKRGQVLGLAGNSGNSDAPHLHFHVMDGASPLGSNGLPYAIDSFEVDGRAISSDDLESELKTAEKPLQVENTSPPQRHTNELPADLVVVRFPG